MIISEQKTITITHSPCADDEVPFSYEEKGFIKWVDEVFQENYKKTPETPFPTLEQAFILLENLGYKWEVTEPEKRCYVYTCKATADLQPIREGKAFLCADCNVLWEEHDAACKKIGIDPWDETFVVFRAGALAERTRQATKPSKAYFLAYGDDRLLGEAENNNPEERRRIIGAFCPGSDGNYYQQILVGFVGESEREFTPGFASWWEWCKGSIEREETLIDEEFAFDPNRVRVISTDLEIVPLDGFKTVITEDGVPMNPQPLVFAPALPVDKEADKMAAKWEAEHRGEIKTKKLLSKSEKLLQRIAEVMKPSKLEEEDWDSADVLGSLHDIRAILDESIDMEQLKAEEQNSERKEE